MNHAACVLSVPFSSLASGLDFIPVDCVMSNVEMLKESCVNRKSASKCSDCGRSDLEGKILGHTNQTSSAAQTLSGQHIYGFQS